MDQDEPIDWNTFDWNADIWLKVGHTRAEIEYLIEEGIPSKLNEACYWVGKNFDDVKQNWEDFKNWKPPSD
jgi:hypothetical protein